MIFKPLPALIDIRCVVSALLAAATLLLASCGGADAPQTTRVRLVQTDSSVGLAAFKALEPASVPGTQRSALTLTGLRVGGVLLPTLDRFGATPYVEIPSGTHDLPGLPIGDFGSLVVQSVAFAPGASVSLIRSPNQLRWSAVVEQLPTQLDAGQAEITLLDVTTSSIATAVQGRPAKLYLTGPAADDPFIAEYPIVGTEPLRNLRVPSQGFRMQIQGDGIVGGPIVFRSGVIRLPQGTHWSGTLHLNANASGQSLVLYSDSSPDLLVVIDERAKMRVINAANQPVVTRVAIADRGAFVALPPGTMEENQPLLPGATVFVHTPQNNSPAPVYQSLPLPPPIPGRGYDIVVRDGATPGTLAASLHRHVVAPTMLGTGSCWSLRILDAMATDAKVSVSGFIDDPLPTPGTFLPLPFFLRPFAPPEIEVYGSHCRPVGTPVLLHDILIDKIPAAVTQLSQWPPSPYARYHIVGVVGSGDTGDVIVPPINAILSGTPGTPILRLYPRTP